jgi:hypothetical protein
MDDVADDRLSTHAHPCPGAPARLQRHRRLGHRAPLLAALSAVMLSSVLAACVAAGASPAGPDPSAGAATSASPAQTPRPTGAPSAAASRDPAPSAEGSPLGSAALSDSSPEAVVVTPAPSAANAEFAVPSLVATVQAEVRVRSEPGVAASSEKLTPLLPLGTELVVLSGPVAADGYHWYEVTPLSSASPLPRGWVAAAGRDGESWLEARTPSCPARPTTFAALAAIPSQLALVCFPRAPITIEARIVDCACNVDGPGYTPPWFTDGASGWNLLIDPSQSTPSADAQSLWLYLDPEAKRPATLPIGKVVTVTGIFDHPAADACVRGAYLDPAAATGECRLWFAVTKIAP